MTGVSGSWWGVGCGGGRKRTERSIEPGTVPIPIDRSQAAAIDIRPYFVIQPSDSIDIPFAPPMTHRVRFVDGLFTTPSGAAILREVLPPDAAPSRVLVVVDSGVATPALLASISKSLAGLAGLDCSAAPLVLPGGEVTKNDPAHLQQLLDAIHHTRLCRKSYLIAVGGGALLDVAGYAAAQAHRGVRLVRVPTTTLAQGDSCVAVKSGVNAYGMKNYLGVFAAPWAVLLDPSLLATLTERDWRSGFSEAVKVALVKDAAFFHTIDAAAARIAARDMHAAWPIIRRSAEIHLRHITDGGDPFELTTARPLDFGHWAAHRLESLTRHRIRHGEAVAIGIMIDAEYSHRRGMLSAPDLAAIRRVLGADGLGFTIADPALADTNAILAGIDEFREHLGGRLTLCMLAGIGRGVDVHDIDSCLMHESISAVASST